MLFFDEINKLLLFFLQFLFLVSSVDVFLFIMWTRECTWIAIAVLFPKAAN